MQVCFVCGFDKLNEDGKACLKCQTDMSVLHEIARARAEPRFLFGSRKQLDRPSIDVSQVSAPFATQGGGAPAARRKVRADTKPKVETGTSFERPTPVALPTIETADEEPGRAAKRYSLRTFAFLLDILCCLMLNGLVMQVVLRASNRGIGPLVQMSLIPLLLVLVTFTLLYFGLFRFMLQNTFGGLVVGSLADKQAS